MQTADRPDRPIAFIRVPREEPSLAESATASGPTYVFFDPAEGRPAELAVLGEGEADVDLASVRNRAEPLKRETIAGPGGAAAMTVLFGQRGVVIGDRQRMYLVPAEKPLLGVGDVRSALSTQGFRALAAFEPLPGEREPIRPPDTEARECPGPPRHVVDLPPDEVICPIHDLRVDAD
ncbi:MAG: hypothetical protein R2725_12610 [Solirubrobacterales bacterium]